MHGDPRSANFRIVTERKGQKGGLFTEHKRAIILDFGQSNINIFTKIEENLSFDSGTKNRTVISLN